MGGSQCGLTQQIVKNLSMNVGESKVAALKPEGQGLVVETQLVE